MAHYLVGIWCLVVYGCGVSCCYGHGVRMVYGYGIRVIVSAGCMDMVSGWYICCCNGYGVMVFLLLFDMVSCDSFTSMYGY